MKTLTPNRAINKQYALIIKNPKTGYFDLHETNNPRRREGWVRRVARVGATHPQANHPRSQNLGLEQDLVFTVFERTVNY